jgi:hypothetical protein
MRRGKLTGVLLLAPVLGGCLLRRFDLGYRRRVFAMKVIVSEFFLAGRVMLAAAARCALSCRPSPPCAGASSVIFVSGKAAPRATLASSAFSRAPDGRRLPNH